MPVHTYSIVARDSTMGELGVVVQSHYFSVGSVAPWAEPGVGVVATQSFLNLAYGPEGLALMRAGRSAPEVLAELVARSRGGPETGGDSRRGRDQCCPRLSRSANLNHPA